MAYYSRNVQLPFADVLAKVEKNLENEGFAIVTSINLNDAFKKKLNIGFRNYKILCACDPRIAYQAITLESHTGLALTCNIIIQEHENGDVEVSAVNPLENLEAPVTDQLVTLAKDISNRLRIAIDNLHRETHEDHDEALPTEHERGNVFIPMFG